MSALPDVLMMISLLGNLAKQGLSGVASKDWAAQFTH